MSTGMIVVALLTSTFFLSISFLLIVEWVGRNLCRPWCSIADALNPTLVTRLWEVTGSNQFCKIDSRRYWRKQSALRCVKEFQEQWEFVELRNEITNECVRYKEDTRMILLVDEMRRPIGLVPNEHGRLLNIAVEEA